MSYQLTEKLSITAWAEEDKPREKLMLKGKASLSDAELIAILIGSGTQSLTAVDVGKLILNGVGNDLNQLAKLTIKDLQKCKGIGEAKAITIIAALELGRRRKESEPQKVYKISNSQTAYELLLPHFLDLPHEEFWIILLNRSNDVIIKIPISTGGVSSTIVDAKIIFKHALEHIASGIVLAHNHPSGNLKPSDEDKKLTEKLRNAGKVLDINIIDHLIITNNGYTSFADEGIL